MPLVCKPLEPRAEAAWDAFVEAHPSGTFLHRGAWRTVIQRAFGHTTHYTVAERDGAIVGVLPLAHVKSLLFGKSLVSAPFCVYGGPLAAEPEAAAALRAHALGLMRQSGASAVEFRYREAPEADDWIERADVYATFRRPIAADAEANMKAIPRKQRAVVRKAIQNRLRAVPGRDTALAHRIYAESVRNLGTPVFARRYFEILADVFGADCETMTVFDGEQPIAAVLSFYFRDEVLPYYGGGTQAARERAGNDMMYWAVMQRAAERGCRMFDFGRSKVGTGAFAFKKNWGFEPQPLHYRYRTRDGAAIPDRNPASPKYRLFVEGWKRLPLPVANALGPRIVRNVG